VPALLKEKGLYSATGGLGNTFWIIITPVLGGKKAVFAIPKNVNASLALSGTSLKMESSGLLLTEHIPWKKLLKLIICCQRTKNWQCYYFNGCCFGRRLIRSFQNIVSASQ
jgi:hypothetical protein